MSTRLDLDRRRFLQSTALATIGAAAAGLGAVLLDARSAWAASMSTLSQHQATTLLVMARHLFPHDQLGDMYYAAGVEALDADAGKDSGLAQLLADGVRKMDGATGLRFLDLSAGNQLKVVEGMEGSSFFGTVRGATLATLYTNDVVARQFGFEGSSVEHGGYINRGFNDLGWLPQLPASRA
jgi:hypothetical protein